MTQITDTRMVRTLLSEARRLLGAGDIQRARDAFIQVLTADPQSIAALNGLAECAFITGNVDTADQYALRALQLAPNDIETLNNAGVILYQRGEYAKAEQALLRAVTNDATNTDTNINLLNVYGKVASKQKLSRDQTKRLLDSLQHLTTKPIDDDRRELLEENHRLRDNVLAHFAGRYATNQHRILLHRPANGALKYLMDSWCEVLNHMGIPTSLMNWGDSTENTFATFRPTVFITVGDPTYEQQLDTSFIRRYRNNHSLSIAHIYGGHRIEPTDFTITFHLDPASHQELAKIDMPLLALPFGINPRRHFMRSGHEVWDYFFVGSNSHLKSETTNQYLMPIVNRYTGVLAGTNWPVGVGELSVNQASLAYNFAKIYPNFHLPWQYEAVDEINERTYIIPACGGFELVDNPAAMSLMFRHDEMAVARSVSDYYDKFAHYLVNPDKRLPFTHKGMRRVYEQYTLFHRLIALAEHLGISEHAGSDQKLQATPPRITLSNPQPSISVIIPTRNRSTLLTRTLAMLTQQDYPSLEVVVVDDASTDDTALVIDKYRDRLPRLVTHRNRGNLGAITSFCKAAELATGEYILMFADDDLLAPGALRELVKPLAHRQADIIYCDLQVIDQNDTPGAVWHYRSYDDKWELMRHLLQNGANVIPEAHLIKREVFDKYYVAWYQRRCVGPIFVPAIDSLRLEYIPRPLYLYRIHSDSTFKDVTGLLSRNKGVTNYMNMIMYRHSPVQLFNSGRGRSLQMAIGEAILNYVKLLLTHGGKFVQGTFYTGHQYTRADHLFGMYYEYAWHWLDVARKYLDDQLTITRLQENIARELGGGYEPVRSNQLPRVYRNLPWFAYRSPQNVCDFVPFDMITVGRHDALELDEYCIYREGTIDMRVPNKRVVSVSEMGPLLDDHVYQIVNVCDPAQLGPVLRLLEHRELYFTTVVDVTGQPQIKSSLLANRIEVSNSIVETFDDYLSLIREGSGLSPWSTPSNAQRAHQMEVV